MKIARFLVTPELLAEMLHLPVGSDIRYVGMDGPFHIEVTVTHDDLRDVTLREGEKPPMAMPMFERREPVVFKGWGQS